MSRSNKKKTAPGERVPDQCSRPAPAIADDSTGPKKNFVTTKEILEALAYRASKEGVRRRRRVTDTELLNEMLLQFLEAEIAELRSQPPDR